MQHSTDTNSTTPHPSRQMDLPAGTPASPRGDDDARVLRIRRDLVACGSGVGYAHDQTADRTTDHTPDQAPDQNPDQRSHVPSTPDVCASIHQHMIQTQGANRVRRYFSASVSMVQIDHETIEIAAGDGFTLDMIQRRLGEPLRIAAQFALATTTPTIRYRVQTDLNPNAPGSTIQSNERAGRAGQTASNPRLPAHPLGNRIDHPKPSTRGVRFPACPSLNDFLVGTSNRLAYESIKQVIGAGVDSPPVFVHGSCGVGKTHLLRGATQYARKLRPGIKVRYTTGEAFTNGFVNAIRTRSVEDFQKKFRGLDLLCIDDIHLMAGKQATQHELLQIFNKLSLGGCTIVLASDAHPREIKRLDQALASRFSAGLVVQIDLPDQELARRLVPQIASKRGVFLDAPATQTILERVGIGRGASVRDLEGAILQIQAVARLMDQCTTNSTGSTSTPGSSGSSGSCSDDAPTRRSGMGLRTPSMAHIRKALSLRDGGEAPITTGPIALESIIAKICQELNVTKGDLTGKGRQKKVVLARELIVHTARNLTAKSFPEIAYAIGRPNHSTVITAAKRFKDRIAQAQAIAVGCTHDGMPAGELAEMMATRVRG
ncbi:MAG: DnaA/Hda family protein [Phycisphaerales bacterium]